MEPTERWLIAQENERKYHNGAHEDSVNVYRGSYEQYFSYLNATTDQTGKSIIEIGCADVPALMFCTGYKPSFIIEPMPSEILKNIISTLPITLLEDPAENVDFPEVDEVWLLNVLQHVMDPDLIIEKCKKAAKVIRFFEPINCGTDICHLHNFTMEYFEKHFGDCVINYPDHTGKVTNFHEHENCYGIWKQK